MTTPKPGPTTFQQQIATTQAALAAVPVQETFTLDHALQMRDTLAARIEHHGTVDSTAAIAIAEGLITEQLINTTTLRRIARAADLPEQCTESLCGFKHEHDHGPDCNHTCPCGKGS